MSSTRDEFLRGLRAAFPGAVSGDGSRFEAIRDGTRMEVEIEVLPPRALGSFALPAIAVRLTFPEAGAEDRARMLAWLDLVTHRGGG